MLNITLLYFDINTGYYPSFHHGLAYLIGTLKKENHNVSLFHILDIKSFQKIYSHLEANEPHVLGISFTTNQKKYVTEFFNKFNKGTIQLLVAGGVHASLQKENLFNEIPSLDAICVGEGEKQFKVLCNKLNNNLEYFDTESFYFKNGNEIIKNAVGKISEIDNLAFPDYTLFEYKKIIEDSGQCFPMMITRGCPFDCSYCCNHALKEIYPNKNNYIRIPSISYSLNIIKNNLKIYSNPKKIIFADDTFTLNKKWLVEFCKVYKEEINIPFLCNARVETIDEQVVEALKNAGCLSIDFGIESGNEWLRKNILNRQHSNKKIKEVFSLVQSKGIKTFSFNIIGLPFETKEMAKDTLKLNMDIKPNFGKSFYFYPYPGSKIYDICNHYDLISKDYEKVSGYLEAPSLMPVFMSYKEVKKINDMMQVFFYSRLLFSKIPFIDKFEKLILRLIFILRKPLLFFLNSNNKNHFAINVRSFLRKYAFKFLR